MNSPTVRRAPGGGLDRLGSGGFLDWCLLVPSRVRWLSSVLCVFALVFSVAVEAGDIRYDYDELGRLVRVTDDQGRSAVYIYGPTGNMLQIFREDTPVGAPTVST